VACKKPPLLSNIRKWVAHLKERGAWSGSDAALFLCQPRISRETFSSQAVHVIHFGLIRNLLKPQRVNDPGVQFFFFLLEVCVCARLIDRHDRFSLQGVKYKRLKGLNVPRAEAPA
jgi:hypothetical protein